MKGLLIASGIALSLGAAAAQAGPMAGLIQGTGVYTGAGYRFVEFKLAGNTVVCAKGDLSVETLEKGKPVRVSGHFVNYAGLYEQVMMLDRCEVRPLPQS